MSKVKPPVLLVPLLLVLAVILSSTAVSGADVTADFGDAPDSSNSAGDAMSAYAGITGDFPTAVQKIGPYGPRHDNATNFFVLGKEVSAEEQAESGFDEDFDGTNNLVPRVDNANLDGKDDGIQLPAAFDHCRRVTVEYTVTLLSAYAGPIYANLWGDWNRDGDWRDSAPGSCPETTTAPEWIMQNQMLTETTPGTYTFKVSFTPFFPNTGQDMWMRLSVSEKQANNDGSAPSGGYRYGETEDYYLAGKVFQTAMPIVRSNSDTTPPVDEHPGAAGAAPEMPEISAEWVQVADGPRTTSVHQKQVQLKLTNSTDQPVPIGVSLIIIAAGVKETHTFDQVRIPANESLVVDDSLSWAGALSKIWTSPATVLGEVSFDLPDAIGDVDRERAVSSVAGIPQIYMHRDTTAVDQLVLYGEEAYRAQVREMKFTGNEEMGDRLMALLPDGVDPREWEQISVYKGSDPIVNEAPPAGESEADHPTGTEETLASATICLEWYTGPVDNNMGEDYGLGDTGWRARGAAVDVYLNGNPIGAYFLSNLGCITLNGVTSGSTVFMETQGMSKLANGSGGENFLYRTNSNFQLVKVPVFVNNIIPGGTYRPEVFGNDAFSAISYAAQARFNGGVSDFDIYVVKEVCPVNPAWDSCWVPNYQGKEVIFIGPGLWRNKFHAAHLYGHAILHQEADVDFDCSNGNSSWTMASPEFASCAAMEGWANFVAGDVWNNKSGSNPDGVYVTTQGHVYSLDINYSACYSTLLTPYCDHYGMAKDWMRQWWDLHTNIVANIGAYTPPSHASLFQLVDWVSWEPHGPSQVSDRIEEELADHGAFAYRNLWRAANCVNGVGYPTVCGQ